ncbi:MAG: hypothetical protein NTW29_22255 [Bacteroidetes bacterium]|nr:hypothetical protein [Bacteroidota bacterium]
MKYGSMTAASFSIFAVACAISASILVACNKDKFTSIPQIDIKSITPTTVASGDVIDIKGKYTDDEGDVDSVLIVYKWYNGAAIVRNDTFRYSLSALGVPQKTRQADITISFEYNTNNNPDLVTLSGTSRDTTASFGIVLKDKEKNRSDYKEAEKIRLKRP